MSAPAAVNWLIWLLIVIVVIVVLVWVIHSFLFVLPWQNALAKPEIVSAGTVGQYQTYNLQVHATINGHPILFEVDTGSDFTSISGNLIGTLGLSGLPPSKYFGTSHVGMQSVTGQNERLRTVDITMSIEGSKPFFTGIVIDPNSECRPLLSLHDLYQAYRMQLIPVHA